MKSLSRVRLFATPQTAAYQAPSMGFSRQEYWSGVPLPSPQIKPTYTLAWKIPWAEEPGRCSPWGGEESDTTERLHFHFSLSCIREGNGNPLQCSCLENHRDRGAWWAAISEVTQSRTRLKRLSSSTSSKAFDCVDHNKLWKILKEMGIPDHLTCLLRNLYAGQEATVRT